MDLQIAISFMYNADIFDKETEEWNDNLKTQ